MISFRGEVAPMPKTQSMPADTTMDYTTTSGGWQISQDSPSLMLLWSIQQ